MSRNMRSTAGLTEPAASSAEPTAMRITCPDSTATDPRAVAGVALTDMAVLASASLRTAAS